MGTSAAPRPLDAGRVRLTSIEFEVLSDLNADLARCYMDVGREHPEDAALAGLLSEWRRERARYFAAEAAIADELEERAAALEPDPPS